MNDTLRDLIAAEPESQLAKAVTLLDSIPGIGPWSAACLACEIGDPSRFAHDKAIIAWAGLDPIAAESGDDRHDYGISHRGNAHVRAILFPLAMTAARFNPVLAAFYQRLITTNGSTRMEALVAVMAKMLRIAYAILRSGKPFDAAHEAARRKQAEGEQAARSAGQTSQTSQSQEPAKPQLDAPISRREAIRRKKAAAPGAEVRDQSPKRVSGRGPRTQDQASDVHAKG